MRVHSAGKILAMLPDLIRIFIDYSLNLSLGELRERLDAKLKEMEHPEEK